MLGVLKNRRVLVGAVIVLGLLAAALWPETIPVETTTVSTGPLVVTMDEDGRTRVADRFVVTAPVSGEVLRIELAPGDPVVKGRTRLATIRPAAPIALDARSRAEAEGVVRAAESAVSRLAAERARLVPLLDLARRELARVKALAAGGAVAREEVERREADVASAGEALRSAEFGVAAAEHEMGAARARLAPIAAPGTTRDWIITSPVDGVVLARHRQSQSIVPAGDVLLEIGDSSRLEIVADLLSADAVKVKAGSRVVIEDWGGAEPLSGRVRRIEPAGFTKISALGVEEQRVNVIIDFDRTTDAARALGDGYRVEVRIVTAELPSVLRAPPGALFRQDDRWAAYVVDGAVARLRTVTVGERNATDVEIRSGLSASDVVVLYPPDTLADGMRIAPLQRRR